MIDRLPRHPLLAIACGLLMVAPTLFVGLFMDDALARVKLLGVETPWSPAPWWDLYTFARPDLNAELLAAGHHPWWADPTVRMTFFRPLSAATHALDYALWPHSPLLQHLHSALWYGLCIAVVGRILRRVHGAGSTIAAVGALAFAVAAPHALTVGWLAGRNTLVAFVIGGLALLAHMRWREDGSTRHGIAALALVALGFLASEAILGALAYIFAWQLCIDRAPARSRLAALVPYGALLVGWRLLYVAAGFGSAGTDIYHDPATDPLDFALAVATHLPALLGARWAMAPIEVWALSPPAVHTALVLVGVACGAALLLGLRRPLRAAPTARLWTLGMLLALVPFTATLPMDRLVLFAGLGFAGLVGVLADRRPSTALGRRARIAALVIYLPLAAAFGLGRGVALGMGAAANTGGYAQDPRDPAVPGQTFVYVASTFHRTHYTTLMRAAEGDPAVPRRSVVLTSMFDGAAITRLDDRTLEAVVDRGYMAIDLDRIHRRAAAPFEAGHPVALPDVDITVREVTADGRPRRVAFRFRTPLEDPTLRWLIVAPVEGGPPLAVATRPFDPPAIGETVHTRPAL